MSLLYYYIITHLNYCSWGPVSLGAVIAGIAAGLQPETVKLSEVFPNESPEKKANLSQLSLDNKWFATVTGNDIFIAFFIIHKFSTLHFLFFVEYIYQECKIDMLTGDLAEAALLQGPVYGKVSVGVNGNWNSSFLPRWYFLKSNEKLEFTTAEIRGALDGLILANEIESLYTKVPTLKLSQILDMYYSAHGLFNSSIRACNRKTLFKTIASHSTMNEQVMLYDQKFM